LSEARSINLPEILTARTDVAAEAAEVAAAEAAFAEDAAAAEAAATVEATAAAGGAAKAAADALGARAALAAELPKELDGGTGGMAEDAEEIPGRPGRVFGVGAREELKTRGGSLSSEGANTAVQAEKSTPIKVLRSLEYSNALILNAITTLNFIIGVHLHGKRYTRIEHFLNLHQQTATCQDRQIHFFE
jgi:hypothetical protein